MEQYYQPQLSSQEMQQFQQQQHHQAQQQNFQQQQQQQGHPHMLQHRQMSAPGRPPMNHTHSYGGTVMPSTAGDSTDNLVSNSSEMNRRRSIPPGMHSQLGQQQADANRGDGDSSGGNDVDRRMSMLEFGNGYGFNNINMANGYVGMSNMNNNMAQQAMQSGMSAANMPGNSMAGNMGSGMNAGMANGMGNMMGNNMGNGMGGNMGNMMGNSMNSNMAGGMSNMNNASGMGGNMGGAGNAMDTFSNQEVLQGMPQSDFSQFNTDMMGMVPNNFNNMNMAAMGNSNNNNTMFTASPVAAQFPPDPTNTTNADMAMDTNQDDATPGSGSNSGTNTMDMDGMKGMLDAVPQQQFQPPESPSDTPVQQPPSNGHLAPQVQQQPTPSSLSREVSTSSMSPARGSSFSTPQTAGSGGNGNGPSSATTPAQPMGPQTPRPDPSEKNVYSKSGFDMLRALWYVATRKNPQIHLGAVDMSCAFVVCDVSLNDIPIIYVSDNFQNLTGYGRHEIMGQNCRFLQAPNGGVEAGSEREFVDGNAVYNLKKKIHEGKEVQQSLINYRKGGKPFLNLLTMIPIPWDDPDQIRFFVGFQIDLVECPDAISAQELGGVQVNYKHSDIGQLMHSGPATSQWDSDNGQSLGVDEVSKLLKDNNQAQGPISEWHRQAWDKMLLENTDDVVHVLSIKGIFLYVSPSCKRVLEWDATELVGQSLSSVCHPSDIVPVTREMKDTAAGSPVNFVYRIRRKDSGYTWFESHGALFTEQGKGRKSIISVGRKRPVFALSRKQLELNGGIGDSELWTKLSTSGMFLFVSSNVRSLLDLHPNDLIGTSLQELMRKESRAEFGRSIEKARRGKIVTCKHEVQNRRGQVLQAQTVMYPGDAAEGQKPTFLLAQTRLLKASSRAIAPAATPPGSARSAGQGSTTQQAPAANDQMSPGPVSAPAGGRLKPGSQDAALAADDNIFDELRTTKCSSWQFELRQMEKVNRILAEELGGLLSNKKKRKRRKGVGNVVRDCANCHTRNTPEWRRGPSGQRDLCNSCGLRWAKQTGRVSPRNSSRGGGSGGGGSGNNNNDTTSKRSNSPIHSSPLHREVSSNEGQTQSAEATTGNTTPGTHYAKVHATMPPPSQPLLEGGSGVQVTSIREERENMGS